MSVECVVLIPTALRKLYYDEFDSRATRHRTPQRFVLDVADAQPRNDFIGGVLNLVVLAVQLVPEVNILEATTDRQN